MQEPRARPRLKSSPSGFQFDKAPHVLAHLGDAELVTTSPPIQPVARSHRCCFRPVRAKPVNAYVTVIDSGNSGTLQAETAYSRFPSVHRADFIAPSGRGRSDAERPTIVAKGRAYRNHSARPGVRAKAAIPLRARSRLRRWKFKLRRYPRPSGGASR